ncbi:MAG: NACHT domain-containing protein, partial [Planktothrix sp.]
DSDAPIPVILELSTWQEVTKPQFFPFGKPEKYDPSIKEWVLSQLISKGVSQDIGEQWLREKELVLLLDGLDELQPERHGKCVQAINQFLGGEFSPLHLVVCSRKEEYEVYEEMLHLNGAICLEDLTKEQIRHYFTSVNLGEFWDSIKESEKIVDFIRQPLFLAVTSIAYQQIDVEEWKNRNIEGTGINYLLETYRLKMLEEDRVSAKKYNHKILTSKRTNSTTRYLIHLSWIAQLRNEIIVEKLDPAINFNVFKKWHNIMSFIFLFSIIILIINSVNYVSLLILTYFTFEGSLFLSISPYKSNESYFVHSTQTTQNFNFFHFTNNKKRIHYYYTILFFVVLISSLGAWLYGFKLMLVFFLKPNDVDLSFLYALQKLYLFFVIPFSAIIFIKKFITFLLEKFMKKIYQSSIFFMIFFMPIKLALIAFAFCWIYVGLLSRIDSSDMVVKQVMQSRLYWSYILGLYFAIVLGGGIEFIQYIVLRIVFRVSGYLPWNITRFLDYCTKRLILQRVGDRYRFIHRLVQEHFANLEIQKE